MPYSVKLLANYRAPSGCRLVTYELSLPRFVLAQLNTHRQLSRNAASSRAIPPAKLIALVENDPVLPVYWGQNQPGMVARAELPPAQIRDAMEQWRIGRDDALRCAQALAGMGVHKQITNRVIEPWMWARVVASATEWENFFSLRVADDAQPEFTQLAQRMALLYYRVPPLDVPAGYWSLPYVTEEERAEGNIPLWKKVSTARVCRVSYLNHEGTREVEKDVVLHDRLMAEGHWSPFEHIAAALPEANWHGNFCGWQQYRKEFAAVECRRFTPEEAQLLAWEHAYPEVLCGS